jgi:hypothetical protein
MEAKLEQDLLKIKKLERSQKKLTNYITKFGKWLLFILPLLLVIVTILTLFTPGFIAGLSFWQQNPSYQILTYIYFIILAVYFFNSIMLIMGALKTENTLELRLKFERKKGRPIDSLDGFDLLASNVKKVTNLLKVISLVCIVSLVLFLIMMFIGSLDLGFAAAGFALVGLGLALLIRSLKLNIQDVNGLQDYYKPTTHQIFLDNFFADILSNHLDPVTFLKWDEYLAGINKILNPAFVQKIESTEEGELPITFAVEKLLFLYYLKYQDVLSEELLVQELNEIINVSSESFDVKRGLLMEGTWYFSDEDIYKLFDFIREYNPGFFNIIDRLQLELADNIERLSNDPIYMDSASQEVVYQNSELNIMVFLYNNAAEAKRYTIKVIAPGFDPSEMVLDVNVEGRGTFVIPNKPIPLTSKDNIDITEVLSTMLENGDTTWLTLEPRQVGEQTIQIYLETSDGVIIEGKTRTVKVSKNLKDYLKKLSSIGSLIGGLAVPLAKILPTMLAG